MPRGIKAPGHFFCYLVGMLIANTLRHTAMVSGAGSYVCVMVEMTGVEPVSEKCLQQLSSSVVIVLTFPQSIAQ